MKQVYLKKYGWCDVITQNGNYSLLLLNGFKICYNTLGHEFRTIQKTLFE